MYAPGAPDASHITFLDKQCRAVQHNMGIDIRLGSQGKLTAVAAQGILGTPLKKHKLS